MELVGYLSTILHLTIIYSALTVLAFSNQKVLILIAIGLTALTFYQSLVLNGCILSNYDKLPFTDKNLTKLFRSALTLSKEDLSDSTFEKLFIGLIGIFLIFKLTVITLFELAYTQPFSTIKLLKLIN